MCGGKNYGTVVGAAPSDYYVFALPAREDHAYFDIDFADRHRSSASRATVSPGSAVIIDLKPLRWVLLVIRRSA